MIRVVAAVALASLAVACAGAGDPARTPAPSGDAGPTTAADAAYPDVVDVAVTPGGDGTYTFDVTISSPYDTPERYADAFRVRTPDGRVLGVRELTHPHQDEQPFTRSLAGVEAPPDAETLVVEARDLVNGWGGATVALTRSELEGS